MDRKALVKSKVIVKVRFKLEERDDMEWAQDQVAEEMSQATGNDLETCKETVRLIVAEFIRDSKVA